MPPQSAPWRGTRVLYLQHPSDPNTWWSTDLIFTRPDWLVEPRGCDVHPQVRWIPFVTFWQVTADMALSMSVPPGHGHAFAGEHVDGWAAVRQPKEWTTARAARLRPIVRGIGSE